MTKSNQARRARRNGEAPANEFRGEARVEVAGKEYTFCLNILALARLCEAFGTRSNKVLFSRLQGPEIELDQCWPADHPDPLLAGKRMVSYEGPSILDVPLIAEALTNGELRASAVEQMGLVEMEQIMRGVALATARSMPSADPAKKNDAGAAETSSETTSPSTNGSDSPAV